MKDVLGTGAVDIKPYRALIVKKHNGGVMPYNQVVNSTDKNLSLFVGELYKVIDYALDLPGVCPRLNPGLPTTLLRTVDDMPFLRKIMSLNGERLSYLLKSFAKEKVLQVDTTKSKNNQLCQIFTHPTFRLAIVAGDFLYSNIPGYSTQSVEIAILRQFRVSCDGPQPEIIQSLGFIHPSLADAALVDKIPSQMKSLLSKYALLLEVIEEDWPASSTKEKDFLSCAVFAFASLFNSQGILEHWVAKIPDLAPYYQNILAGTGLNVINDIDQHKRSSVTNEMSWPEAIDNLLKLTRRNSKEFSIVAYQSIKVAMGDVIAVGDRIQAETELAEKKRDRKIIKQFLEKYGEICKKAGIDDIQREQVIEGWSNWLSGRETDDPGQAGLDFFLAKMNEVVEKIIKSNEQIFLVEEQKKEIIVSSVGDLAGRLAMKKNQAEVTAKIAFLTDQLFVLETEFLSWVHPPEVGHEGQTDAPVHFLIEATGEPQQHGVKSKGGDAPATKVQATPGAKVQATPGAKVQATPGAKVQATPATKVQATPATKVQATPATKVQATPATKVQATPATKVQATPATNSSTGQADAPTVEELVLLPHLAKASVKELVVMIAEGQEKYRPALFILLSLALIGDKQYSGAVLMAFSASHSGVKNTGDKILEFAASGLVMWWEQQDEDAYLSRCQNVFLGEKDIFYGDTEAFAMLTIAGALIPVLHCSKRGDIFDLLAEVKLVGPMKEDVNALLYEIVQTANKYVPYDVHILPELEYLDQMNNERTKAIEELQDLQSQDLYKSIFYVPAANIMKVWLAKDGIIGSLFNDALNNYGRINIDKENMQERINNLFDKGYLEELIVKTNVRMRGAKTTEIDRRAMKDMYDICSKSGHAIMRLLNAEQEIKSSDISFHFQQMVEARDRILALVPAAHKEASSIAGNKANSVHLRMSASMLSESIGLIPEFFSSREYSKKNTYFALEWKENTLVIGAGMPVTEVISKMVSAVKSAGGYWKKKRG